MVTVMEANSVVLLHRTPEHLPMSLDRKPQKEGPYMDVSGSYRFPIFTDIPSPRNLAPKLAPTQK